jgi:hypothetical protein
MKDILSLAIAKAIKKWLIFVLPLIVFGHVDARIITRADFSENSIVIDFDKLPDGTSIGGIIVPPYTGPVTNENEEAVIDDEYSSLGVRFSSANDRGCVAVHDTTAEIAPISSPNSLIGRRRLNHPTQGGWYWTGGRITARFFDPETGEPAVTTRVGAYAFDVGANPVSMVAYDINGNEVARTYFPVLGDGSASFRAVEYAGGIHTVSFNKLETSGPQGYKIGWEYIAIDDFIFEPVTSVNTKAAAHYVETTISATAIGWGKPKIDSGEVVNGDFLISDNNSNIAGDGAEEDTYWVFDFTTDPGYVSFPLDQPLTSALLTLTLTPKHAGVTTDVVFIEGLEHIKTPLIRRLNSSFENPRIVEVELLEYYSSDEILGELNNGILKLRYRDDAVISFARLDLVTWAPVIGAHAHVSKGVFEATSPMGTLVHLDGSDSRGPDGQPIVEPSAFEWDFDGDGNPDAFGPIVEHIFPVGHHEPRLTIKIPSLRDRVSTQHDTDTLKIDVVDTRPPAIKLLSPHGGEVYAGGSSVLVCWEPATDVVGIPPKPITLYYSVDGGDWQLITQGEDNDGRFDWRTPPLNSADVKIKIEAMDSAGNVGDDASPASFTVDSTPPTVTVLSPNGGEILRGGDVSPITWQPATDNLGLREAPIRLLYSADNGASWQLIAEGELNDGRFDWNVPEIDGDSLLIRVEAIDSAGNVSSDDSDSSFSVDSTPPGVTLIYPNGGEIIRGGDSVDISWQPATDAHLASEPISLYYSLRDSGWIPIAENLPNTGSYTWVVPKVNSDEVRVKVVAEDVVGHTGEDTSDDTFRIDSDAPTSRLTIISPSKDETQHLQGGNTYTIVWALAQDNFSSVGEVSLSYSTDGGASWISIAQASNLGDAYGYYEWDVPKMDSDQVVIRVEARDEAGNWAEDTSGYHVIDSTAPDAPILNPLDSPSSENVLVLTGKAESYSTVTLYDNSGYLGTAVADENGDFSFTTPALVDGEHNFTATATDKAGNTSQDSNTVGVRVDTTAPEVKLLSPHGGEIYRGGEDVPILWEPATDTGGLRNGPITLYYSVDGGDWQLITQGEDNDGRFDWRTPPLNSADVKIKIEAMDSAGNVGHDASPASFTVDSTPPTVTVLSPNGGEILRGGDVSPITWQPATDNLGLREAPIRLLYSADNGASWQLIAEGELNDGRFDWNVPEIDGDSLLIRVEAIDSAGNVSSDDSDSSFSVDSTPPGVTLIYPNGGEIIRGGDSVDISWQPATDAHLASEPISLYYSLRDSGWIPIAENLPNTGSYTWVVPKVNSDEVRVKVVAEDVVGHTGEDTSDDTFRIDSDAPTSRLTIISPSKDETQHLQGGNTYTIVWALAQDNFSSVGEVSLSYSTDGGASWISIAQASNLGDAYGYYEWDVPKMDSDQVVIRVEARDEAGNWAEDTSGYHVIDSTAPDAPELDPLPSPTRENVLTLSGKAEPGSVEMLYDSGGYLGTAVADENGDFSFTTPALADGEHSFTATAADKAGNISTASDAIELVVDTTTPDRPIPVSPADSSAVNLPPTLIWGDVSDITSVTYHVQVDNDSGFGSPEVDISGIEESQLLVTLSDGTWFWRVQAVDEVGHVSDFSPTFRFTLDTVAPDTPVILSPETGRVSRETTLTIVGAAEAGSRVDLYDNGVLIGFDVADDDGGFALIVQGLAEGEHAFTATATDSAGNVSEVSDPSTVIVDTTIPEPPVITSPPSGSITDQNVLTLTGTAETGSTVTLLDNGEVLGATEVDSSGSFSYTTRPLADGVHSFTATATDVAGNVSDVSKAITVTVDTVAPTVSVSLNKQEYTTNEIVEIQYEVADNIDQSVSVTIDTSPDLSVNSDNKIPPPLPVGSLKVTVTATDDAGNSASAEASAVVKALRARLDVVPDLFKIYMPRKARWRPPKWLKGGRRWGDRFKFVVLTCYLSLPEGLAVSEIDLSSLRLNDSLEPEEGKTEILDSVLKMQFKVDKAFVASLLSVDVTLIDKLVQSSDSIYVFLNDRVEIESITLGKLQVAGALENQAAFVSEDASRQITLKAFAAPVVTHSQLGQNFPNPFNPETWIPYALGSDSEVVIEIYDVRGNLVRRLDLGYREAGFYMDRSSAAYWDGRNEQGERVATGVYIYTISAGEFRATRRMVLVK